jgi:hypothetical protein
VIPLAWLNPGRWLAVLALSGALTLSYFGWRGQQREIGRQEARAELRAATDAQTARNRELQRAAELRYTVQAETRDRFIVTTVKEIHNATDSLAACPVGAAGVRLLNAGGACARGDSKAACGSGQQLPGARRPE